MTLTAYVLLGAFIAENLMIGNWKPFNWLAHLKCSVNVQMTKPVVTESKNV